MRQKSHIICHSADDVERHISCHCLQSISISCVINDILCQSLMTQQLSFFIGNDIKPVILRIHAKIIHLKTVD